MIIRDKVYIGGQWVASSGSSTITQINATTEEILGRVPKGTVEDIDRAVAVAREAFDHGEWRSYSVEDRAARSDDTAISAPSSRSTAAGSPPLAISLPPLLRAPTR